MAAPVGSRVLSHPDMMNATRDGAARASGGGGTTTIAPVLNITIDGSLDAKALVKRIKEPLVAMFTNELSAAMR